jgi:hypothetical protein
MVEQMIKPIENWKDSWKFSSVQLSAVGFTVMGMVEAVNQTWITLPPHMQALVPMAPVISWGLFGITLVSRLFTLSRKTDEHADS